MIWLKDPSGEYGWQVLPTGAVATAHRCGPVAGGFHVARSAGQADRSRARTGARPGWPRRVPHPRGGRRDEDRHPRERRPGGLTPGDAAGYRGAGIGTKETRTDWSAARLYGLDQGRETVFAQAFDPIARGAEPGATLAFKKAGGTWHLVTSFPVDVPGPTNERLEDLE
ncbi:hypothetical protein [Jiangella sp. DSM 45060]|uniref:hypothetical protein n=1 Tax=Jiangella sp. DSM 45060 TaxID=1798224 RepID=UPI0012FD366F|nr:hypothetical protein [Jiangella sp. DSM 45060]